MNILPYLSKKYVIGAVAGVSILALSALGFYLAGWRFMGSRSDTVPGDSNAQVQESQSSESAGSVKVEGTGIYTVEAVPLDSSGTKQPAYPPLERALTFPADYPAEARRIMTDKINATIAALKKDPNQYNEWVNLGIFRNSLDDWEGARQIWEFLTIMSPSQPSPFANLANLYAFSLKDPVRAEINLKKAIEKGPKETSIYRFGYE
ncbi:MAG: hypothetical protein HYT41_01940, partial [Candidatus Sungbacteria bacterium]|nr:hypothetical protein [Candidatus Sungbacteria bacterium]